MKNLTSYAFAIVTSLVMMSCSTNESAIELQEPQNLLKSFSLERNSNGEYYVNTDQASDVFVNQTNKTVEVHAAVNDFSRSNTSESLVFNNDKVKVDFIQNTNSTPSITIFDDEETKKINYLNTYKISANEDGTYQLDFTVNKGISVNFEYNKATDTYEIHLAKGKQTQSSFTKVFDVEKGEVINLSFVNHLNSDTFAKGESSEPKKKDKPRGSILT